MKRCSTLNVIGFKHIFPGHHVDMAKEHGALLLAVEHRFYGDSVNPDGLKTENLAHLSSQQALVSVVCVCTCANVSSPCFLLTSSTLLRINVHLSFLFIHVHSVFPFLSIHLYIIVCVCVFTAECLLCLSLLHTSDNKSKACRGNTCIRSFPVWCTRWTPTSQSDLGLNTHHGKGYNEFPWRIECIFQDISGG